jgi:transcriptional regulator with XRE-family HTH domain
MEMDFDKRKFAIRLKEIRKSKGLTQEQICDLTGIEISNYSKMETGKVAPSMSSILRLINFAGFVPNEMFDFNHLELEENLDKIIFEMYQNYSFEKKKLLYKLMRNLNEFK